MEDNVNFFNDDAGNIEMPDTELKDNNKLDSPDITKVISRDKISNVSFKETDEIDENAYLIDIRGISVSKAMLLAIKGLLKGGDTAVYIQTSDSSRVKVGMGDGYELYMVLEDLIRVAYGNECPLYRNNGKGFKRVSVSIGADNIKLSL